MEVLVADFNAFGAENILKTTNIFMHSYRRHLTPVASLLFFVMRCRLDAPNDAWKSLNRALYLTLFIVESPKSKYFNALCNHARFESVPNMFI